MDWRAAEPFSFPGVRVGHWTHPDGFTGCTVVLPDERALAIAEVRGGAPGTRELALLDQGRLVQRVDAILLTGGSAFGLAAADGVVHWLRERGRGFPTSSINVPIVPAAVLYDLVGPDPDWPNRDAGWAAAEAASTEGFGWRSGRIGAGTGARVGKTLGPDRSSRAGLGVARITTASGAVAAILAVNALGDVVDPDDGHILRGARVEPGMDEWADSEAVIVNATNRPADPGTNTTIGAIAVDAPVDRDALVRIGIAAHDGLARAIRPAHTAVDGDTIFVLAINEGRCRTDDLVRLATAAQRATATAIVNAVPQP